MGKGTKKFIESSDKFLEKASSMLDTAIENESLKIEDAKEYADLIHKCMQSVKLMTEPQVKKGKGETEELNGKSLAERMGKQ